MRPTVRNCNPDQDVFRRFLGVLDKHVKVAIVIEDTGIQELIFHVVAIAPLVRLNQIAVGKRRLRVLVQVLHVGVRGRAVEIEVIFLHVLAMVALAVGESEHALFEDRIRTIPQRQGKAEDLIFVANAGDAVFAPVVGAGARLIVGEIVPGISSFAIVLTDRPPLPFAEVGSPLFPVRSALAGFLQT